MLRDSYRCKRATIGGIHIMEWRVYILTGGKRFTYYATRSKAEALDKLAIVQRRHGLGAYEYEIEPVTF